MRTGFLLGFYWMTRRFLSRRKKKKGIAAESFQWNLIEHLSTPFHFFFNRIFLISCFFRLLPCALSPLQRLNWVLLGFPGFHWVLLGFPVFYWVSLSFTRFYWVSLSFTMFHSVLLGLTGFYWVSLSFTGFYWVSLCFTGFY